MRLLAISIALVLIPVPRPIRAQTGRPVGAERGVDPQDANRPTSAPGGRAPYVHDRMAPSATAVPTTGAFVIDGVLDESAWMSAPAITDFVQLVPDEGEPVSERTEVRILYDDDYVYVGGWLWAEGPILSRLSRKDAAVPDADFFAVHFDSYHDHRLSYRFGTWPSGVKKDLIQIAGGGLGDTSWDPVWDLGTTVTDEGWFVEMRIPFSQLRYRADEVQHWGFQLERKIRYRGEDTVWAFTPRSEAGGVARFGHLEGIEGIRQGKRLELLPFVTGRAELVQIPQSDAAGFANPFRSGSDFFGNAGLDLKYQLGTALTLDATVNPDFGQVELDPAVINLTAFETRFEEKRPFFVEGADIFRFGDLGGRPGGADAQLVYSRRIGRPPQGEAPDEAVYADAPTSTTILGAMKLSGRTASGWSIGVLDALADRTEAPWVDAAGTEGREIVEPRSNYLAARMRRDVRQGTGSFGFLATAVNRNLPAGALESALASSAYSMGVDGRIEWDSQTWMLAGKLSGSRVAGSADALTGLQRRSTRYMHRPDATHLDYDPTAESLSGFYGKLDLLKQSGSWQGNVGVTAISPGYEVNDLGFQSWADRIEATSTFGYEQPRAGPRFRSLNLRAGAARTLNFGGDVVGSDVDLSFGAEHVSFNRFDAKVTRRFAAWDDRLTRGGPLSRRPAGYGVGLAFRTDRRKVWQLDMDFGLDEDDGGGWSRSGSVGLGLRFLEIYELQIGPSVTRSRTAAQYVTSVADPAATSTFGRRYVFAPLEQTTVGLETRLNVTFTPDLTLELYAQPFLSSGDFGGLMELATPRTFDFVRYGPDAGSVAEAADGGYDVDPDGTGAGTFHVRPLDFDFRSLRGNAVLRWEWRTGSTLFLVWQQTRSERLFPSSSAGFEDLGRFDLGPDARALFGLEPDNIFMVKMTYWLNP